MMSKIGYLFLLAALTRLTSARTYDSSDRVSIQKTAVKYAGPMVYSNLPPPVVYFPSMPKIPKNSISGSGSSSRPIEYIPLPYQDLPVLIYRSIHHPPIHVVHNIKHGSTYAASQDANKDYVTSSDSQNVASEEGGRGFGKYANSYDDYEQGTASESYGQISSYSQLPSSYEGYQPAAGYAQAASESYSQLPSGYQNQDDRYNSDYLDNYDQNSDEYSQSASGYRPTSSSYNSPPYGRQYPRGYQQMPSSSYGPQASYEPQMSSNNIRQMLKGGGASSSGLYQAEESYMKPIVAYPPTALQIIKGYRTGGVTHTVFQPKPIFLTSPSSSNAVYIPRPPMKPGDEEGLSGGRYGGGREVGNFPSMSSPAPHIIYTGHPPIHVFPQPIIVKEPPKPSEPSMAEQGDYAQASETHSVTYGGSGGYDGYKSNGDLPYGNEESYQAESGAYHDERPSESDNAYGEAITEQSHTTSDSHPSPRPVYQTALSSGASSDTRGKGYLSLSGGSGTSYGSYPAYSSSGSYSPSSYDLSYGSGYAGSASGGGGYQFGGYEGLKWRPSKGIMGRLTALGTSLLIRRPFGLSSILTSYRQPSTYYVPQGFPSSASSFVGRYRPTPASSSSSYGDLIASGSEVSETYKSKDYGSASDANDDIPYPKVNYNVPPTASTAAPYHQKPPIIIYQGIRPPVYVYSQASEMAKEKKDDVIPQPLSSVYENPQETMQAGHVRYEGEEAQQFHQPAFSQQESQTEYDQPQVQSSAYEATPISPDDFPSEQELQGYENNAVERADHPEESEEQEPHSQDPTDRSGWVPINFPEDQKTEENTGEEKAPEEDTAATS